MMLKNLRPAADYQRFATETLAPWDDLFVARIRQSVRTATPGLLADIGTGTGVALLRLASHPALAQWRFVGLDLDPSMLAECQPRIARLGWGDRIELRLGDALDLPFADGSVDRVVSRATLHHLADKPRALAEMARVLRPGGIGVLHDMRRDAPAPLLAQFQDLRHAADYPPTHPEEKLTLDEAKAVVVAAGLERQATVFSPASGWGALGFEILILKN